MIGSSVVKNILGIQYTIGELMNIDAKRQLKAKRCRVKLIKTYHHLKRESILDRFRALFRSRTINKLYLIFKFEVRSDTGNKHTIYIQTNPDFSLQNWAGNKVKIYCDCADFKYRSAYILAQRNSLFLTGALQSKLGGAENEAPKRIAPTLLCKHAFASLNWLMNNYQKVMGTV